jgi:hypothetical protein
MVRLGRMVVVMMMMMMMMAMMMMLMTMQHDAAATGPNRNSCPPRTASVSPVSRA